MITWVLELTMKPRVSGVRLCFTVLMEVGKVKLYGDKYIHKWPVHWLLVMYSTKFVLTCLLIVPLNFSRLFSCGTSKDGESFLVEWNESEGAIKRTYNGFRKKSAGVVQFDTTQNRFLAAGEDGHIKFWDMDNVNLLTITDAEGGLQVSILAFNCLVVYSSLIETTFSEDTLYFAIISMCLEPSALEI